MAVFTGNSTGKVGGLFFPQGFANGGPIQRLSPPSTINVQLLNPLCAGLNDQGRLCMVLRANNTIAMYDPKFFLQP